MQEVCTEDENEQSSQEEKINPNQMQINPNYDYPSDEDDRKGTAARVDGASPLSDRLAISGYFRASDPGRFGEPAIDNVSDIQIVARRESQLNRQGKSGKRKKRT